MAVRSSPSVQRQRAIRESPADQRVGWTFCGTRGKRRGDRPRRYSIGSVGPRRRRVSRRSTSRTDRKHAGGTPCTPADGRLNSAQGIPWALFLAAAVRALRGQVRACAPCRGRIPPRHGGKNFLAIAALFNQPCGWGGVKPPHPLMAAGGSTDRPATPRSAPLEVASLSVTVSSAHAAKDLPVDFVQQMRSKSDRTRHLRRACRESWSASIVSIGAQSVLMRSDRRSIGRIGRTETGRIETFGGTELLSG